MRLTLGRKVEHNHRRWRVMGDGFDYSDNFGYILSDGDDKIFVKEEELSYNNNYDIRPEDCQLVKCSNGRTVINHGAFSNDHKRLPWRIGDIIKDRYGNILTVVTRGDIVYYFCARIDSYIYQLPDGNDNIKLGTNATHCSITGEELTDAMEVHTKCGVIYINKRSKPEFVKQSCLSGNWYEPQYFHLVLGKDYENLYVGFDELHLVGNNPDLAICNVTHIPFYIEDERDIVKNTGIHPMLVDSLMVTCPISNLCGAKKDMLVGYIHNQGNVFFHPSVKDQLVCYNGTYGRSEEDFFTVEDTGEKYSYAVADQFYRAGNGQYYSSQSAAPMMGVHSYRFKPEPKFFGNGKKFIGIELEFHSCGESDRTADRIIGPMNNVIYAKHDGSLHDGIEFVTHPCTPEYHLNDMDWNNFIQRLVDNNGNAGCGAGIHMHVNRNYFKDNLCIARMVRFIENHHDTILHMSNRTDSDRNWCEKYRYTVKEIRSIFKYAQNSGAKYRALNLCPAHTIEFRMFRSTVNISRLKAYIQFVDALTSVANMQSIKYIGWSHIRRQAEKRGYTELINLLNSKNIGKVKEN